MFKGYRSPRIEFALLIVAILAFIFVVVSTELRQDCPNEPCNQSQTTDNPKHNTSQGKWNAPNPIRRTFSHENEPSYSEEPPSREEYYDLQAQERMAHATDWIAWITLISSIFGVFGLGALVYTLFLQRASNKIMLNEQRPWLVPSAKEGPHKPILRDGTVVQANISVFFSNAGKSAATNMRLFAVPSQSGNTLKTRKELEEIISKAKLSEDYEAPLFPDRNSTSYAANFFFNDSDEFQDATLIAIAKYSGALTPDEEFTVAYQYLVLWPYEKDGAEGPSVFVKSLGSAIIT